MVGQFAVKARGCANVFPCMKEAAPASPFFSVKGRETCSKKCHILMCIRHRLLFHLLFSTEGDETLSKKLHILMNAVMFSTNGLWMQLVLHKKLSLRPFRRKYRPNLWFQCRQKLLVIHHYSKSFKWMRSKQKTGKMYKLYKNFWEDFVVEQNITCPYKIVVVWDDRTTGNNYGSLLLLGLQFIAQ